MSVKEYENVWRNSRPLLETADGAMAPWSTLERACHYVDSADYDAIAAELAAYKLEDVQWEQALAKVAGDMDRIVALEAELAKEKGGWDAFYKLRRSVGEDRYPGMLDQVIQRIVNKDGSLSVQQLLQELINVRANLAAELALRQTAEAYAARNALRVIELEEVLQEMLDVRGVNTQEAYDVRARARKTLGSTLYPIDTSAKPVEESAKDRRIEKLEEVLRDLLDDLGEVVEQRHHRDKYRVYQISPQTVDAARKTLLFTPQTETPCRIKEHDGAFKCYAHNKSWGAISKPDAPCVGWSTKETKGEVPTLEDVRGILKDVPETNCNQADAAPSDADAVGPTPRGILPNSLGASNEKKGEQG